MNLLRRLGAKDCPKKIMFKTSGTLFSFIEDIFPIRGFRGDAPSQTGYHAADVAAGKGPARGQASDGLITPANENDTRGLSPMISVAVAVCPVSPLAKRA